MSSVPEPVSDSPKAFAYPEFRRYYMGAVTGTNGGWITRILLSWLAWDLTGSPSFVGAVAAASLLPVAIVGPIFGVITDRMSTRVAFQRVAILLFVVPLLILGLVWFDAMTPGLLFATALLFGVVMSAYHPVRQSIGPRLVSPPAIGAVVALAAVNFNVGRLLAPAIGGLILARYGEVPTALLGVCLAFPNAVIARTLNPREGDARKQDGFFDTLREGFAVVWSRWAIRRSILLSVAALGLIRGIAEILALIADGIFERGAEGLGLLTSSVGAGALVAALFQVVAGNRFARQRVLRLFVIFAGFGGVLGIVHAPSFELAMAAALFIGFSSTWVGVSLQIGLQARLEDELRGRVMSIWMLSNTASTSFMAFGLSWLSEATGLPWAASMVVGICAAAVIVIWLRPVRD